MFKNAARVENRKKNNNPVRSSLTILFGEFKNECGSSAFHLFPCTKFLISTCQFPFHYISTLLQLVSYWFLFIFFSIPASSQSRLVAFVPFLPRSFSKQGRFSLWQARLFVRISSSVSAPLPLLYLQTCLLFLWTWLFLPRNYVPAFQRMDFSGGAFLSLTAVHIHPNVSVLIRCQWLLQSRNPQSYSVCLIWPYGLYEDFLAACPSFSSIPSCFFSHMNIILPKTQQNYQNVSFTIKPALYTGKDFMLGPKKTKDLFDNCQNANVSANSSWLFSWRKTHWWTKLAEVRRLPKFKRRNHKNTSRVASSSNKMPEISPISALKEPKHKESTPFGSLPVDLNVVLWPLWCSEGKRDKMPPIVALSGYKIQKQGLSQGPARSSSERPLLDSYHRVLNEYVSAGDYICWRASHQQSLQAPHKIDPADSWIMWGLCGPWDAHTGS